MSNIPDNVVDKIHPSWLPCFEHLYSQDKMGVLKDHLKSVVKNRGSRAICPTPSKILEAFTMDLNAIRVVIVGQDPYPSQSAAIGLAFAHPTSISLRPSLVQIKKEIERTEGEMKADSTLQLWVNQGVFLLNRSLTTETGSSNAHTSLWSFFTNFVAHYISEHREDIIWLLWGNSSQAMQKYIHSSSHVILKHTHPQAANYQPDKYPFVGCDHFRQTNLILEDREYNSITW